MMRPPASYWFVTTFSCRSSLVVLHFSHPVACVAVSHRVLSIPFVCVARRSLLDPSVSPHQQTCTAVRRRLHLICRLRWCWLRHSSAASSVGSAGGASLLLCLLAVRVVMYVCYPGELPPPFLVGMPLTVLCCLLFPPSPPPPPQRRLTGLRSSTAHVRFLAHRRSPTRWVRYACVSRLRFSALVLL